MKLYFCPNPQRAETLALSRELAALASSHGFQGELYQGQEPSSMEEGVLVVLGGDGSLLRKLPLAQETGCPLLGVHCGHVGFLTETDPQDFPRCLELLQRGAYRLDRRSLLSYSYDNEEDASAPGYCLNDALLFKRSFSGVARIHIRIDGKSVGVVSGDGVVVSSPTGSTAYSLSAGGPVLMPRLEAMVITPVCPHNLHMRPVVTAWSSRIELYSDNPCMAIADGKMVSPVRAGNRLYISGSHRSVGFLRFGEVDLFERIHRRLT